MAVDSASILSIALQVVSAKVVVILALGVTAGLFCWALWLGTWLGLAIAASFAVLVFLPILFRQGDSNGSKDG